MGNTDNLFELDEAEIESRFRSVNLLEEIIKENTGQGTIDMGKLAETIPGIGKVRTQFLSPEDLNRLREEDPLGIPPFLWGFGSACFGSALTCLGGPVLGGGAVLFIYLMTDENKEEAEEAAWGCVAGTGAGILIYILIFFVYLGTNWYGI